MFESRTKWFSILLALIALVIIARLVDIQIIRAGYFEKLAERMLTRPVTYLRAVRGSILDRSGRVLATDEPTFDVSVHFDMLSGGTASLRSWARALRKRGDYSEGTPLVEIEADLRQRVDDTWQRLADLTGRSAAELHERGEAIYRRVKRVRESVRRRHGYDQPVEEENMFHALVEGVSDETALAVRMEIEVLPWVSVPPSSRRVTHDADDFCHLLGRLGAVSLEHIENDPFGEDELRRLRPGERVGISGVERLGETTLRGTRGKILKDFDGAELERVEQVGGGRVRLTIDAEFQGQVLGFVREAVQACEYPSGGAAVVIDVRTREILALASYPTFRIDALSRNYDVLSRDRKRMPLRSRAIQEHYPPGSPCKIATLTAALTEGVTTVTRQIECRGYLHNPRSFRCWYYRQYGLTHGLQTAEEAVKHSCNIYFYTVGEELGAGRLCEYFKLFGMGRTQGTGLIEEASGIVPDEAWMMRVQERRYQRADARNFAIGQGEVSATPLQVANTTAAIASGRWEPVKLLLDGADAARPREAARELPADALRVARRGMWRVVNEQGGTAVGVRLDTPGYQICGKTGSAQSVPRVIRRRYTLQWPDGRTETVTAVSRAEALRRFSGAKPRVVGSRILERYPNLADEAPPSHAWFIGYTQTSDTPLGATPRGRAYAIAVLIEYGGSGGQVAGPVAKRIAEAALARPEF